MDVKVDDAVEIKTKKEDIRRTAVQDASQPTPFPGGL